MAVRTICATSALLLSAHVFAVPVGTVNMDLPLNQENYSQVPSEWLLHDHLRRSLLFTCDFIPLRAHDVSESSADCEYVHSLFEEPAPSWKPSFKSRLSRQSSRYTLVFWLSNRPKNPLLLDHKHHGEAARPISPRTTSFETTASVFHRFPP